MRRQDGFTLVETVIALGVTGIILTVISIFAINSFGSSSIETAKAELLGESQITMDRVIRDIRLSAGAETNNRWPDANKSGGDFTWASSASTLVLATAAVNSNNEIIFSDPARYISEKNNVIYFVSNGTLYKRMLASPVSGNAAKTTCPSVTATCPKDQALLKNVTGFSLKYFNGDNQEVIPSDSRSVELRVTTQTKRFGRTISSDYTTRAVFRND